MNSQKEAEDETGVRSITLKRYHEKRILILTAGFGEGHNTAARNIRDAFNSEYGIKAEILDLFELSYGHWNSLLKRLYIATINHAPHLWNWFYQLLDSRPILENNLRALSKATRILEEILTESMPDIVISTYPVYSFMLDDICKKEKFKPISRFTVITDSITINSLWHRAHSDFFLTPNHLTAEILQQRGIPENRIGNFGFPVTSRFADLAKIENLRPKPFTGGPFRVLIMIHSGKKNAPDLIKKLLQIEQLQLTITVGRDDALKKKLQTIANLAGKPIDIHGWTPKIADLLAENHLLISKAGGATVQEATAARCPMIVSQVVPGQEEGNARLIVETGSGCIATTPDAIVDAVKKAITENARQWHSWERNISKLSSPDASLAIAKFILETKPPSFPKTPNP